MVDEMLRGRAKFRASETIRRVQVPDALHSQGRGGYGRGRSRGMDSGWPGTYQGERESAAGGDNAEAAATSVRRRTTAGDVFGGICDHDLAQMRGI